MDIEIMGIQATRLHWLMPVLGLHFYSYKMTNTWTPGCYKQAIDMVELSISCHEPIKLDGEATWARLLSRLFLEMCLLVLHRNELAFFYLHEAVSQILMQGIDRFIKHESLSLTERTRRERVYWICCIHERHLALEAGTIVCLDPLPALPDVSVTAFGSIERGWNYILQTFLVIDKDFISLWNGDRSSVTAEWIIKKHQELTDGLWQREVSTLPITQQADLIITRQWLQTLTWQMAMSNALLSSEAGGFEGLSLFLPLRLSAYLKGFLSRVSKEAIQIHGIGIIEKLFEITTTIADIVVALAPGHYPEAEARVLDVLFMKQFFLGLPHVKDIHRAIIEEKMSQIEAVHIHVGQSFAHDSIDEDENRESGQHSG